MLQITYITPEGNYKASIFTDKVKQFVDKIWNEERIPTNWKRGLIIKLPKKGNIKQCKNWRGITLYFPL